MRYEFEFDYSDDMVRAGAKRAIRRQFGGKAAVPIAAVLAIVIAVCMATDAEYMCGVLQGAFGLLVILVVTTAMSAQERALKYARKLPTRKARCTPRSAWENWRSTRPGPRWRSNTSSLRSTARAR